MNVRIVAANLTSGNQQSYSPDNETHTNDEGAGGRILKGLKPDVVLIQEFNTEIGTQQWVTETFGADYKFAKEDGLGIPNGIVSRFPIVARASGTILLRAIATLPGRKSACPTGEIFGR